MTKVERENWQQEMFSLIKKWKKSGIQQQEFCEQHDLSIHTFYYWLRKYKRAESSGSGFIPVEIQGVKPRPEEREEIRIEYPNGVLVRINESVKISRIKALINAV
jgi:transposase-like protein